MATGLVKKRKPRVRYVCPNTVCLNKKVKIAGRNCFAYHCQPTEVPY